MMILEKAWAKIKGRYDKIENGVIMLIIFNKYIFLKQYFFIGKKAMDIYELFLGCTCQYLDKQNNHYLFEAIKENEKNLELFLYEVHISKHIKLK